MGRRDGWGEGMGVGWVGEGVGGVRYCCHCAVVLGLYRLCLNICTIQCNTSVWYCWV